MNPVKHAYKDLWHADIVIHGTFADVLGMAVYDEHGARKRAFLTPKFQWEDSMGTIWQNPALDVVAVRELSRVWRHRSTLAKWGARPFPYEAGFEGEDRLFVHADEAAHVRKTPRFGICDEVLT